MPRAIPRSHRWLSPALALASVVCAALWLAYSYKAGCAADLKTLSDGDVAGGLRLSAIGLYCAMAAMVAGALGIGFRKQGDVATRLGQAAAFVFLGGLVLGWAGLQFEAMGAQRCLH